MCNADVLQQLIAYGSKSGTVQQQQVDVHAKDFQAMTPLHLAAYVGQPACCKILLQAGANSTLKDTSGDPLIPTGHADNFPVFEI